MKPWIKIACITSLVFQITVCSSSTQTNDSKAVQIARKTVQQGTETKKSSIDIPGAYKDKLKGLDTVKGKVVYTKDGDTV
ncbi:MULTISPECIES: hypothetical protein [unclassified Bacillus (in: firmicutes)]|uniref:hypothetical protein n=1 Tax=unclassified Bacillus (in: firmicutes) TaxID=185979 RepID=UPI003651C410